MSTKDTRKGVTIRLRIDDASQRSERDRRNAPERSQAPARLNTSKSPYKIYELPRRSYFSEYLETLRHNQPVDRSPRQAPPIIDLDLAGPSRYAATRQRLSVVHPLKEQVDDDVVYEAVNRQESVLDFRFKERAPFKDTVKDYFRKRTAPRKTIRIYKIPVPMNWEQALENSLKNRPVVERFPNRREPRLLWLEQLEEANKLLPIPVLDDDNMIPCCCFPIARRRP